MNKLSQIIIFAAKKDYTLNNVSYFHDFFVISIIFNGYDCGSIRCSFFHSYEIKIKKKKINEKF